MLRKPLQQSLIKSDKKIEIVSLGEAGKLFPENENLSKNDWRKSNPPWRVPMS